MGTDKPRAWNSTLPVPSKPLQRKTPIKPVNRERRAKRREEGEVYGPYHQHISAMRCLVENDDCLGVVVGHHLKTVGAGGKDARNEIPLCAFHHREIHDSGTRTFEDRHEIDVDLEASFLWQEYVG